MICRLLGLCPSAGTACFAFCFAATLLTFQTLQPRTALRLLRMLIRRRLPGAACANRAYGKGAEFGGGSGGGRGGGGGGVAARAAVAGSGGGGGQRRQWRKATGGER